MDRDSGELKALRTALKMLGKTEAEASKFIAEKDVKGTKAIAKSALPGDYDILEKEGVSKNFVKSVAKDLATDIAVGAGLGVLGAGAVMGMKAARKGVKGMKAAAKARMKAKGAPNVRSREPQMRPKAPRKVEVLEVGSLREGAEKAMNKEIKDLEFERANIQGANFKNLKGKKKEEAVRKVEEINEDIRLITRKKAALGRRKGGRTPTIMGDRPASVKKTMETRPTEVLEPLDFQEAFKQAEKARPKMKDIPETIKLPQDVAREIKRTMELKISAREFDAEDVMELIAQQNRALGIARDAIKKGVKPQERMFLEVQMEDLENYKSALEKLLGKLEDVN